MNSFIIRLFTFLVVLTVAVFAFVISFSHIFVLGTQNGQHGAAARLLPLSIDGLIVAASLVLLEAALSGRSTPPLARAMLWAGVAATLASNALYGRSWGALGILVSTLPAASFVGAVEMLFGMVRSAHKSEVPEATRTARHAAPAPVPADVLEAATVAYRASVAAHSPLSVRTLADRFGLTRPAAAKVVKSVNDAMGNGHHSDSPGGLVEVGS